MSGVNVSSSELGKELGFSEIKKIQFEEWRMLLHRLDSFEIKAKDIPVHAFLKWWAGSGGDNKEKLIKIIQENPEAAKEAKLIQDFAQRCLIEEHKDHVNLFPSPKIRLVRGINHGRPSDDIQSISNNVRIKPWDSLTTNVDFASTSANPYLNWGWKIGTLIEIDVPTENIFTYWDAHPAFNPHLVEREYILNEKGAQGAFVVSIDGHAPTLEQATKLKENMPNIEVVLDGNEVAKLV